MVEQSGSCDSLFSKHDTRFTNSGESLSEGFGNSLDDDDPSARFSNGNLRQPQVPPLITACIDHLTNYGLHVVGIFRVSTSKRRIREVCFNEHFCNWTWFLYIEFSLCCTAVTWRAWLWFTKNIRFGDKSAWCGLVVKGVFEGFTRAIAVSIFIPSLPIHTK